MSVNKALITRRKAAAALNTLVTTIQLGSMAERFDGDADKDWSVYNETHVIALKNGQRVADIIFNPDNTVQVEVEDAYMLIRSSHIRDFQPHVYGIDICNQFDFLGDKIRPDLCAIFDQPEVLGLYLPKQPMEVSTMRRRVKVIGAL